MKNFQWSYSRLKNFETCALRFLHYDVLKDTVEDTRQQSEGHAAHKAYELRIREGKKLPMPLTHHEPILAKLEALPGDHYAEQKLALTSEFKPTGFFSPDVWFRTVLDFCNVSPDGETAAVVDYKTGKPGSDMTQLQLMSVTTMHFQPTIQRVRARLLFMNHNHAERAEFTRADITEIWTKILPRVRKLREAVEERDFPPRPNGLCTRYCAVTSCPFHGRGSRP
jgi:hypothetical protein